MNGTRKMKQGASGRNVSDDGGGGGWPNEAHFKAGDYLAVQPGEVSTTGPRMATTNTIL